MDFFCNQFEPENPLRYFIIKAALICTMLISVPESILAGELPEHILEKFAYAKSQKDTIQVYLELGEFLSEMDYFAADSVLSIARNLAGKYDFPSLNANANRLIGANHWLHGEYDRARENLSNSIDLYREFGDTLGMAKAQNTLALVYYYQADYKRAISFLEQSLENHKTAGDSSQIARVANNLGLLYGSIGDFVNSIEYFILSTKIRILYTSLRDRAVSGQTRNPFREDNRYADTIIKQNLSRIQDGNSATNRFELARLLAETGKLYQIKDEYDSAILLSEQASEVYKALGWPKRIALEVRERARSYFEIGQAETAKQMLITTLEPLKKSYAIAAYSDALGDLYDISMEQSDFDMAVEYATRLLRTSKEAGHVASVCRAHRELGEAYLRQGRSNLALAEFNSAYKVAQEINSFREVKESAFKLYTFYKMQENDNKALAFYEDWVDMNEKMKQAEATRIIEDYMARSEVDLRNAEITRLNQLNASNEKLVESQYRQLIIGGIGLILVLVSLITIFNRYRKIVSLKETLGRQNELLKSRNKENEILLAEIHHRVKNNLQMISSLLSMQNRRITEKESKEILRLTINRIQSIGLIHEFLFKNRSFSDVNLGQYIHDLTDMVLRSQVQSAEISIEVDDYEVDLETVIPFGLILNELLTNSIKYGLGQVDAPKIQVQLRVTEKFIWLVVDDNGPGTPTVVFGFGWTIINTILKGFNGTASIENERGFKVEIKIPKYSP